MGDMQGDMQFENKIGLGQINSDKFPGNNDDINDVISEASILIAECNLSLQKKEWLLGFENRFEEKSNLHPGIKFEDVKRSLLLDPKSMEIFMFLDSFGHEMNVFGEEDGTFIFVSAWLDFKNVSPEHRWLIYDSLAKNEKEDYLNPLCRGDATSIVHQLGVSLAYAKYHLKLIELYLVRGRAWLHTSRSDRIKGNANIGNVDSVFQVSPDVCFDFGSFRAMGFVKRV
jgi:hypothetical protein